MLMMKGSRTEATGENRKGEALSSGLAVICCEWESKLLAIIKALRIG